MISDENLIKRIEFLQTAIEGISLELANLKSEISGKPSKIKKTKGLPKVEVDRLHAQLNKTMYGRGLSEQQKKALIEKRNKTMYKNSRNHFK